MYNDGQLSSSPCSLPTWTWSFNVSLLAERILGLITHLLFSFIIISFPLLLLKCYNFLYWRAAGVWLFTCTWVNNVELLPTKIQKPAIYFPNDFRNLLNSRIWITEETQCTKHNSWYSVRSSFLLSYCFVLWCLLHLIRLFLDWVSPCSWFFFPLSNIKQEKVAPSLKTTL